MHTGTKMAAKKASSRRRNRHAIEDEVTCKSTGLFYTHPCSLIIMTRRPLYSLVSFFHYSWGLSDLRQPCWPLPSHVALPATLVLFWHLILHLCPHGNSLGPQWNPPPRPSFSGLRWPTLFSCLAKGWLLLIEQPEDDVEQCFTDYWARECFTVKSCTATRFLGREISNWIHSCCVRNIPPSPTVTCLHKRKAGIFI